MTLTNHEREERPNNYMSSVSSKISPRSMQHAMYLSAGACNSGVTRLYPALHYLAFCWWWLYEDIINDRSAGSQFFTSNSTLLLLLLLLVLSITCLFLVFLVFLVFFFFLFFSLFGLVAACLSQKWGARMHGEADDVATVGQGLPRLG